MEKINIAELLKDCPKGMELDCSVFEDVTLYKIDTDIENEFPIRIKTKNDYFLDLTKYGTYSNVEEAKCIIFPKGKITWEGFQRPFKDGDVVVTKLGSVFILKNLLLADTYSCYAALNHESKFIYKEQRFGHKDMCRFATEDEKQKLFDAIKANGYKWDAKTKTLEKLVEPIFKKGDIVKHKESGIYCTIGNYADGLKGYHTNIGLCIADKDVYNWELVPNKFDISKLKPFDKVLVRDFDSEVWDVDFFSRLLDGKHFKCLGLSYVQCIPYEGNEYLHNSTDACNDYFKTWEK